MVRSASKIDDSSKLYQDFVKVAYAELVSSNRTDGEIRKIAKGINIINDEEGSDTVARRIVTRSVGRKSPNPLVVDMARHACDQISQGRLRRVAVRKPVINDEEENKNTVQCVAPGVNLEPVVKTNDNVGQEEGGLILIEEVEIPVESEEKVPALPAKEIVKPEEEAPAPSEEEMQEVERENAGYLDLYEMNRPLNDISKILSSYSDIESINMPINADDVDLKMVADLFPNIRSIDVRFCPGVTIEGIRYIAQKCLSLEHLSLSFSPDGIINNPELHEVLKGCGSLKQISLVNDMPNDFESAPYFESSSLKVCLLVEPDARYNRAYNSDNKTPRRSIVSDQPPAPAISEEVPSPVVHEKVSSPAVSIQTPAPVRIDRSKLYELITSYPEIDSVNIF